jgi:hypothetical protein
MLQQVFKLQNSAHPAPPHPGHRRRGNTQHSTRGLRARRWWKIRGEAPPSRATEEDDLQPQTPPRPRRLPSAARGPTQTYLYTRRDPGFPYPPAAGAADGGERNPRSRRR